jgi:hypothetical protein
MVEEVTVTDERTDPYRKSDVPGLSPLQAGLLYGAGGAAIGGPIGLLAGLFAGVVAKRGKESYLDRVARDVYNTRSRYQGVQDEIKTELDIADPDEARLLRSAQRTATEGWQLLQSGDESGRALIEQANETIRGIMNSDIQARKAEQAAQFNTQRGLITTAATSFRDQYSTTINQAREVDSRAQRVLELVADPTFDTDKPFSKSLLTELVSSSLGGMFKDDPNGLLNGLAELGSSGSEVGAIVAAFARGGKAIADKDEFKISREEYNKVALNIREVTKRYASQRLGELRQQSEGLNAFGRQVGAIPQDYNLADYVSGGVSELQLAPAVPVPTRPTASAQPTVRAQPWQNRQQPTAPAATGPTRRTRQQLTAPVLSDDWFREQIGIPTQRQRRPTN